MRHEGRAIIGIDKARWSILGDELLQALGQGIGRLGCDFVEEGILAEEITDKHVIFACVVEVVSCDLLPWAVWDIPWEHGLCGGEALCLVQLVHWQT